MTELSSQTVEETLPRQLPSPRIAAERPSRSGRWIDGECAQHAGRVYGLVAPAWEHAAVVADVVTGADPTAEYAGSRTLTRLKAAGIDLAAMGESATDPATDDEATEVVQFVDAARGTYKKLVLRDGRVVGAILLGDGATAGAVVQLFDRGTPAPADPAALLFPGADAAQPVASPAHMPGSATVCHCNNVTKSELQDAWLDGCRTAGEIARATRATTGCGSCRSAVEGICEWLRAADPEPIVVTPRSHGNPRAAEVPA